MTLFFTIVLILFNILLLLNLVAARALVQKLAAQNSVLRLMVSIEDRENTSEESE